MEAIDVALHTFSGSSFQILGAVKAKLLPKCLTDIEIRTYFQKPISPAGEMRTIPLATSPIGSSHDTTRRPSARLPGVAPPTVPAKPLLRHRAWRDINRLTGCLYIE